MRRETALLDRFRLAAAVLVVCIHTSPLASFTAMGDFWLTRVLARVAVPFFLMATGYFLGRRDWKGLPRQWKKLGLLYLAAVALYLPLNLYMGELSPLAWLKALVTEGTLYHLWYFPALLLGLPIAWLLRKLGRPAAMAAALGLYLIGLGGDSYYGLVSPLPGAEAFYGAVFAVFGYSRCGLFYVPLFLLLGDAAPRWRAGASVLGFGLSLAGMSLEGLWLHALGYQRHDSMYLLLPVCMTFLFSLLLRGNRGQDRAARRFSMLVYILHPWSIVLVRFGARLVGLEGLFIANSLGHFAAVLALTALWAWALTALWPQKRDPHGRAWREVDLEAIAHNAAVLRAAAGENCRLMAVVKADGYGHGAVPVARRLQKAGVRAFAVACLDEAVALRRAGIRGEILILGWTPPEAAPRLRRWRLTQTVADLAHARALSQTGVTVRVHLALDTGMHRLGLPSEDVEAVASVWALPHLQIRGVFSHLCVSDSPAEADRDFTQGQLRRFYACLDALRSRGLDTGAVHIQASYGVLNLPPQPCAYVRAGIALYGVQSDSAPVARSLDLRPALSLRARVAAVRTLSPGEGAGYGLSFRAQRVTRLATVAIGYADGLPRDLPARGGAVLLRGTRCPMVGRMCMDQLLVDVTDVPDAAQGDTVTLIGRDGAAEISAVELAETCGTITNELFSRLGARLALDTRRA